MTGDSRSRSPRLHSRTFLRYLPRVILLILPSCLAGGRGKAAKGERERDKGKREKRKGEEVRGGGGGGRGKGEGVKLEEARGGDMARRLGKGGGQPLLHDWDSVSGLNQQLSISESR